MRKIHRHRTYEKREAMYARLKWYTILKSVGPHAARLFRQREPALDVPLLCKWHWDAFEMELKRMQEEL